MIRIELTAVDTMDTLADLVELGRYAEVYLKAKKRELQPEEPYAMPAAGDAGAPPADTAPKQAPAPAAATKPNAPEPEPPRAEKPPKPEEVRAKGLAAARKYGKEAVKSILKKFGVENMSLLEEADRATFIQALEELEKAGGAGA